MMHKKRKKKKRKKDDTRHWMTRKSSSSQHVPIMYVNVLSLLYKKIMGYEPLISHNGLYVQVLFITLGPGKLMVGLYTA